MEMKVMGWRRSRRSATG